MILAQSIARPNERPALENGLFSGNETAESGEAFRYSPHEQWETVTRLQRGDKVEC
jgi:hypothetical protein